MRSFPQKKRRQSVFVWEKLQPVMIFFKSIYERVHVWSASFLIMQFRAVAATVQVTEHTFAIKNLKFRFHIHTSTSASKLM